MIRPKKSLSQNFLNDQNISNKIIGLTKIENKNILEIGPGYGFLTDNILSQNPKNLTLIEKDDDLVKLLKQKYTNNKNVKIYNKDILKFDLKDFNNLIIISNLPYNISSKVILKLYEFSENIDEMIFMIQKEMAIKFDYNLPKMNKYKFITKIISSYAIKFDVSSNVFFPKPKVKSSVVMFKFNKKNFNLKKANSFANIIFKNIRKKIYNNLKLNSDDNLLQKRVDKLTIDELINIYNLF